MFRDCVNPSSTQLSFLLPHKDLFSRLPPILPDAVMRATQRTVQKFLISSSAAVSVVGWVTVLKGQIGWEREGDKKCGNVGGKNINSSGEAEDDANGVEGRGGSRGRAGKDPRRLFLLALTGGLLSVSMFAAQAYLSHTPDSTR